MGRCRNRNFLSVSNFLPKINRSRIGYYGLFFEGKRAVCLRFEPDSMPAEEECCNA